jgi:lipoprotein-anchoring transpeptidase ErfK/SrfK
MRWYRTLACVAAAAVMLAGSAVSIDGRQTERTKPADPAELHLQVLLDRAGFSPGEIDGTGGQNTRRAQAAFEAARKLPPGAQNRAALLEALGAGGVEPLVSYTITAEDAAGPFVETIPEDMAEKAKLPGLYFSSLLEALGERFHADPALLKRLNPGATFAAGEEIKVPNVLAAAPASAARAPEQAGKAPPQEKVKIVVSKETSVLTVYNDKEQVVFHAPVTSGSEHDPLPVGDWVVTAVLRNPTFYYNPDLFWDADPKDVKAKIPAGPNNPVGVVWIDLDKPHYGIHGGPEPGRIGYSASHGCVRLTNWDAARLAGLVAKGTPVVFAK